MPIRIFSWGEEQTATGRQRILFKALESTADMTHRQVRASKQGLAVGSNQGSLGL